MEQDGIIDERRKSAKQAIITNNYHNIFEFNVTLMNTSQNYLSQISNLIGTPVFDYQDPITTIQNIFRNLSQSFISAFLTVIDDRNNMLGSTRDLVLNFELYNTNSAILNTLLTGITKYSDWQKIMNGLQQIFSESLKLILEIYIKILVVNTGI
jgi:F0F1-type ATP synthase delta subunit